MIVNKIRELIDRAEGFKNSYFWRSPQSAGMRRAYEKKNSIEKFTWEEGGNEYTAEFTVSCSAKNVYAKGVYTKNGTKTTLTAIKNSLLRLEKNQ